MRKSKIGSDRLDRRKHNKPPEQGKIVAGEIRNQWGRAGKPRSQPPNMMDELFWHEANRIVSHDDDGPVDAKKRLVQEEFAAALRDRDSSARTRLLAQLSASGARIDRERREFNEFVLESKALLDRQFYLARKCGKMPPEVLPHPDHVKIVGGRLHIHGPTDRSGRSTWESIKAAIQVTACLHEIIRNEYQHTGRPAIFVELKSIEKHRRWLMRAVPKGWNWREEIFCRDSKLDLVKDIIRTLKETGYVAPDPSD